jgi:hypothetical protein
VQGLEAALRQVVTAKLLDTEVQALEARITKEREDDKNPPAHHRASTPTNPPFRTNPPMFDILSP